MIYSIEQNNYLISTDKSKIDVDYVHGFLSQSYWSPGVPVKVVRKAMKGSLCFGVYYRETKAGWLRKNGYG